MKRLEVCFVDSPNNWGSRMESFCYLALSAWLEREGISNEIVDMKADSTLEFVKKSISLLKKDKYYIHNRIVKEVIKLNPKFVCFSVFTNDYEDVMYMAKKIKENIDVKIVVGNAHSTIKPDDFIFKSSPVDYAVIGEGDVTLAELIKAKDISKVLGVAFLKDDSFYYTGRRNLIEELSVLPLPNYKKINMKYYLKPRFSVIRGIFISAARIYTGRGCPFKCEFCAANTVWKKHNGKPVRFRPVSNVIKELKYMNEHYKIEGFYIMDDTFSIDKKRVLEFCKEFKKLNLIWGAETRVNLIDEEMLIAMKDSGCVQLDFGVESANQKLLDALKKGITIPEIIKAFELCKKHNVRTCGSFLVNIPNETEKDIYDMDAFIKKLNPDFAFWSITTPYLGTPLYEKYMHPRLKKEEYSMYNDSRIIYEKRFRFASHSLDFNKICKDWEKKYGFKIKGMFKVDKMYWKKILLNRRLPVYLYYFLIEILETMINLTYIRLKRR